MAEEQRLMSESEKNKEDWMNSKWRPMMGWMYMLTCIADFVVFPILWSLLQAMDKGSVTIQWQPITLQGAGLFHIAMGAVLGIAAYGRTQEKMSGANNGGITLPSNVGTTYIPPAAVPQPTASGWGSQPLTSGSSFANTPTTSYGSSAGFVETAPTTVTVVTGFGGKPAPVIPPFPER
jgi:hypothetical protein